MLSLTSTWFGLLSVGTVVACGWWIFLEKLIRPNIKYAKDLMVNLDLWTEEMKYVNNTRLAMGFLGGFLAAGVICVLIYTVGR